MRTRQSTKDAGNNTGNRILIIAFVLVGWMLLIVGRMYWLQVVKHDHYLTRARENQQSQYETMAARGAIVDTGALLAAINSGKVGAAGLDVLEEEPLLREEHELLHKDFAKEELMNVLESHILLNNKKVIITPHNAFNSREALIRILRTTEENINGFLSGNPKNLAY